MRSQKTQIVFFYTDRRKTQGYRSTEANSPPYTCCVKSASQMLLKNIASPRV
jgi:hypothetical protein